MDELETQRRAREFVREAKPTALPVQMELYSRLVDAVIHVDDKLNADESGWSTYLRGKLQITVNGNDSSERQRFTICHEIAHHVLELPSEHEGLSTWSYNKRPPNEVLCDVFAAELLLPLHLFKPLVDSANPGFAFLESISSTAEASLMATGSRFAAICGAPCAFVLTERGKIRYASRSTSLRAAGAWIEPRSAIPTTSVTARVCAGERCNGPEEIDPDVWFTDWNSGGTLFEEAKYFPRWQQSLTLLWGDEEEIEVRRSPQASRQPTDFEYRELDGNLPWPGRKKRK